MIVAALALLIPSDLPQVRGGVAAASAVSLIAVGMEYSFAATIRFGLAILAGGLLAAFLFSRTSIPGYDYLYAIQRLGTSTWISLGILPVVLIVWNWWLNPPSFLWQGLITLALPLFIAIITFPIGMYAYKDRVAKLELEYQRMEARQKAEHHKREQMRVEQEAWEEQQRVRKERIEQQEREVEQHRRAEAQKAYKQQQRRERAQQKVKDDEKEAATEASALEAPLDVPQLLLRDAATLETLFRMTHGLVGEETLVDIASARGLSVGETMQSLRRQAQGGNVRLVAGYPRKHWWEQSVHLTVEGCELVRAIHASRESKGGLQVNGPYIHNIHGNFTGVVGGDAMQVTGNSFIADQRSGPEAEFVRVVREAQAEVDEQSARQLDVALSDLQGPDANKSAAVQRIIGMARTLGDVGAPIIDAGQKLAQALGS